MNKLFRAVAGISFVAMMLAGCGEEKSAADKSSAKSSGKSVDGAKFLLTSEPNGAQSVIAARKSAKDKEEIVIIGRIGGRMVPLNKSLAAFTITDSSLKPCAEGCATPWDY